MAEVRCDAGEGEDDGKEPIAAYKQLLRGLLDRRPSGTRQRVARAIGTHRSFISQITNPAYKVPLPAQHGRTIMAVCHFSAEEREHFLAAYEAAHPGQLSEPEPPDDQTTAAHAGETTTPDGIWIPLPRLADAEQAARVASAIRSAAAAIIAVAAPGGAGASPDGEPGNREGAGQDHRTRHRRR